MLSSLPGGSMQQRSVIRATSRLTAGGAPVSFRHQPDRKKPLMGANEMVPPAQ